MLLAAHLQPPFELKAMDGTSTSKVKQGLGLFSADLEPIFKNHGSELSKVVFLSPNSGDCLTANNAKALEQFESRTGEELKGNSYIFGYPMWVNASHTSLHGTEVQVRV